MKTYQKTVTEYGLKKIKSDIKSAQIKSSNDAAEYARQFYFDDLEIYESMFIMLLNRRNNVEGYAKISQGGTAGTVVDVKIIANYAVNSLCSSVIMIHNHPSGNLEPSQADKKITENVKYALQLFGVTLLDHIILSADGHYSFSDNGEM